MNWLLTSQEECDEQGKHFQASCADAPFCSLSASSHRRRHIFRPIGAKTTSIPVGLDRIESAECVCTTLRDALHRSNLGGWEVPRAVRCRSYYRGHGLHNAASYMVSAKVANSNERNHIERKTCEVT